MSFFGGSRGSASEPKPAIQVQVADEEPHSFYLNNQSNPTGAAQTLHQSHTHTQDYLRSLFDVGIFKDTLAPSFALHSSLAVVAWGIGRATNRVEAKDWLCTCQH